MCRDELDVVVYCDVTPYDHYFTGLNFTGVLGYANNA